MTGSRRYRSFTHINTLRKKINPTSSCATRLRTPQQSNLTIECWRQVLSLQLQAFSSYRGDRMSAQTYRRVRTNGFVQWQVWQSCKSRWASRRSSTWSLSSWLRLIRLDLWFCLAWPLLLARLCGGRAQLLCVFYAVVRRRIIRMHPSLRQREYKPQGAKPYADNFARL